MLPGDQFECRQCGERERTSAVAAHVAAAPHQLVTFLARLVSALSEEREVLRLQQNEALYVLDAVLLAMALVDRGGRVVYVNREADKLLSDPDGLLGLSHGMLIARRLQHQKSFNRLFALASASADQGVQFRNSLFLRSQSKDVASLSIGIVPFGPAARYPSDLYLLIAKALGPDEHLLKTIRQLFELTDSEAAIASSLAAGLSLAEAAQQLGIKVSTARTHLSRIFQKTDTQQQSQLVSLLRDAIVPVAH